MTIKNAKMHFKKPTNKRYGIRRKGSTGNFSPLRKVAEIVSAELSLRSIGDFTFEINGVPQNIPIKHNCTLTFDNDCRNDAHSDCQPGNDSQLFYQLIADKRDPQLRYEFTRIPDDKEHESHPDGNCDPAVSDPPPG